MRALGPRAYLQYRWSGFAARQERIPVTIRGHNIIVRRGAPDLKVAIASLGPEYNSLARILPRDFDGIVVDAGAYIGTAGLSFARLYPQATIVCIEPSTENHEILLENTRSNPNIVPIKAALAVEGRSRIKLRNRGTGQWGFTVVQSPLDRPEAPEIEEVDLVSLEEIQERFPGKSIGILKLDIEGGEKDLFTSGSELLASVPAIVVELHDRIREGCSTAFAEFSKDRWIVVGSGEKFLSLRRAI